MNKESGELKSFGPDENLQEAAASGHWVGMSCKPKASCRKCYGRGHEGRNTETGRYVICSCVRKIV